MIILIIMLQFRLWSEDGGIPQIHHLEDLIEKQKSENEELKKRNKEMYAQIKNLSNEYESDEIEERARKNLGLIKEGETFFLVVEKK